MKLGNIQISIMSKNIIMDTINTFYEHIYNDIHHVSVGLLHCSQMSLTTRVIIIGLFNLLLGEGL